jgi:hypothetical protein
MRKNSLEKKIDQQNPIAFSFAEVSSEIDYSPFEKKTRPAKRIWIPILSCSLALLGTLALILAFRPFAAVNEAPAKGLAIQNPEQLVVEYEKNTSFVGDGLLLSKTLEDGKKKTIPASDCLVDASSFRKGVVGKYEIAIALKNNALVRTSYFVNVVDDEVIGLTLSSSRSVYYLGEVPFAQDVIVTKNCQSGINKEAKPAEYTLDLSSYESGKLGTYSIGVSLKSNPEFRFSFPVEVQPLENADLTGRYAYTDTSFEYGQPTIYALDIEDGKAYSRNSEIALDGALARSFSNGTIVLKDEKHDQLMTYLPKSRTLLVQGIAGDPDLPCFRMNHTDQLLSLIGAPEDEMGIRYVAIDGRIPISTLDYFAYRFGGAYLDAEMEMAADHDHIFEKDSWLYVGVKPIPGAQQPYLGVWYREDVRYREVAFHILEGSTYRADPNYPNSYSAEEKSDGTIWLRLQDGELLVYHSDGDSLEILAPDTGKTYLYLKRYNPVFQLLLHLDTTYQSPIDYVVDKGTSFNSLFLTDNDIQWYTIPGYDGGLLFQDTTFKNVSRSSLGISDFSGMYGTLKDHFLITGSWDVDRLSSGHSYWLEWVKDYQTVRLGWIQIKSVDEGHSVFVLRVHFESGDEEEVRLDRTAKRLTTMEAIGRYNATPWKDLPFLGTYTASDGSVLLAKQQGFLAEKTISSSGVVGQNFIPCRFSAVQANEAQGVAYVQGKQGERLSKAVRFFLEKGAWSLTYDGTLYQWNSSEQ